MIEEWRPVVGWAGLYEVSDMGRVRSLKRRVSSRHNWHASTRLVPPRILQQAKNRGYLQVNLAREGKRQKSSVHRLVLEAFRGPAPTGTECLHGNGDPSDNRLDNLRWGSPAENNLDILRHHGWRGRPPGGDTCRNGHVYAEVGIVVLSDGARRCKACRQAFASRRRAAKALAP